LRRQWEVEEAKRHLGELIDRALVEGPQIITRQGTEHAVVLSSGDYRTLEASKPGFKEYLFGGPRAEDFVILRDQDTGRVEQI